MTAKLNGLSLDFMFHHINNYFLDQQYMAWEPEANVLFYDPKIYYSAPLQCHCFGGAT